MRTTVAERDADADRVPDALEVFDPVNEIDGETVSVNASVEDPDLVRVLLAETVTSFVRLRVEVKLFEDVNERDIVRVGVGETDGVQLEGGVVLEVAVPISDGEGVSDFVSVCVDVAVGDDDVEWV